MREEKGKREKNVKPFTWHFFLLCLSSAFASAFPRSSLISVDKRGKPYYYGNGEQEANKC
jgi:hypothetical protein